MQQIKNSGNMEAALAQFLQNNPNTAMIANILNSGNSLEGIARQMAQTSNVDINDVINGLLHI